MKGDLLDGKTMFGRAATAAEPIDGAAQHDVGTTARMQLMAAYLTVLDCGRRHFTHGQDFVDFTTWRAALQGSAGTATAAIASMTALRCKHFARRLHAIARRVAAR